MKAIELDVFERNGEFVGKKRFYTILDKHKSLNQWWVCFKNTQEQSLGMMSNYPSDFQNQQKVCILSRPLARYCLNFTQSNIIPFALYFAVRHCIPATWLNDRDQFLYPNEEWQKDSTFQNDCLAFTLFHGQNRITSKEGVNHFIPFSESQVGAKEAFESHFMRDFIKGKIRRNSKSIESNNALFSREDLEQTCFVPTKPLEFSAEAQEVFKAGLELWKYYHSQEFKDSANPYNPNASLYDIKAYFQGFSDKGKMNPPQKAQDSYYKDLLGNLNYALKLLAKTIEPKVYEYGFLRE